MTDRSSLGARTLPGEYYTDPAIYGAEIDTIFRKGWIYVASEREIADPGDFVIREIAGDSLVVLRDRDGEIRAHHNVCRHRGARLITDEAGTLDGPVRCPYHAWCYALDGTLIGAPNMADVDGFDRADHPLVSVDASTWNGLVFVRVAPGTETLEQHLAGLWGRFDAWRIPELDVAHRTVYEVAANWKLLVQNYSECYHCPGVHPHLNRLTPYKDSFNDLDDGSVLGGPMKLVEGVGGSMTMSGRACAAPLGEVAGDDLELVYYYTIFPNLFLSLHPDYVLVHRAEALAFDRTRITCEWLFHPDATAASDFSCDDAVAFWDLTNRQDWELCERTQLGVGSSAFRPGRYSNLESQLAAFDRHYLGVLGHRPVGV